MRRDLSAASIACASGSASSRRSAWPKASRRPASGTGARDGSESITVRLKPDTTAITGLLKSDTTAITGRLTSDTNAITSGPKSDSTAITLRLTLGTCRRGASVAQPFRAAPAFRATLGRPAAQARRLAPPTRTRTSGQRDSRDVERGADAAEDVERAGEMLGCVRGRTARAQHALIDRTAWRDDQVDVEPLAQKALPERDGARLIAGENRDDRRFGFADGVSEFAEAAPQAMHVRPQLLAQFGMRADDGHGRAHAGDVRRRSGGGEHVRARHEMQHAQFRVIRDADPADAGQRLREGADDEVHLVEHPLILGAAESPRAVGPERVRLVDEEVRTVRAADVDDVAQRRDVAADRIETFDDDQPVPLLRRQPLELLAQAVGRVVTEADHLRRGLPGRVVDARVAVAVDQDDVARAAQSADE